MKSRRRLTRETGANGTVVLWIGLSFLMSVHAYGQGELEQFCSEQSKHASFIDGSLNMVREGAGREAVLNQLACIAKSDDRRAAVPALRALFHVASDDNQIRNYLLAVINDDRTSSPAASEASRLFVYVADEEGRSELLELVKRQWDNRGGNCKWSAGWEALIELGDVAFLRWLDRTAEALGEDDPLRPVVDRARTMIRLQESPSDLLAYMRSDREDIDRAWIVRQAMRHGASRNEIRDAVLEHLGRVDEQRLLSLNLLLVRACDEYGILNTDDVAQINTIRAIRQIRYSSDDQSAQWPKWTTDVEAKRAKFYRLEH